MARRVLDFVDDRVAMQEDARTLGKALSGALGTLWRYRAGDFRAICEIQDRAKIVLVLQIGNRGKTYR